MSGRFWLTVSWLRARLVESANEVVTMLLVGGALIVLGLFLTGLTMRFGWFG